MDAPKRYKKVFVLICKKIIHEEGCQEYKEACLPVSGWGKRFAEEKTSFQSVQEEKWRGEKEDNAEEKWTGEKRGNAEEEDYLSKETSGRVLPISVAGNSEWQSKTSKDL